jgi:hypothetical protein
VAPELPNLRIKSHQPEALSEPMETGHRGFSWRSPHPAYAPKLTFYLLDRASRLLKRVLWSSAINLDSSSRTGGLYAR